MSLFPDQLYVPAQADAQKGIVLPTRYAARFSVTSTAPNQLVFSNPVPPDKVLVLTNAFVTCVCSSPEFVVSASLRLSNQVDGTIGFLGDLRGVNTAELQPVGNSLITFQFNPIVIMPAEKVSVNIIYDSIGASKSTFLDAYGVMYPRGNWQYAQV